MARPVINVDVEYAQIEIAGVWYSIEDVHAIIERLQGIMEVRDWDKHQHVSQAFVDIGYNDPTTVYQIKLTRIAEMKPGTSLAEIIGKLKHNGINNILIDSSSPREADMMKEAGMIVQRVILRREEKR